MTKETGVDYDTKHILQFFTYAHLPERLQDISAPFAACANGLAAMTEDELEEQRQLVRASQASAMVTRLLSVTNGLPPNPESTWAEVKIDEARQELRDAKPLHQVLRKVLEAKDCAVRAVLAKAPGDTQGAP